MSLNIQIMSAEELASWYTPKTESEQALFDKLKETLNEISNFEQDHRQELGELDDKNTELLDRIKELEEEQDELRNEKADLEIECNDLKTSLTLI